MVLYSFRDFKAQTAAVHTRLDEMKHRWECLQATLDSCCCFLLQRYLENTIVKTISEPYQLLSQHFESHIYWSYDAFSADYRCPAFQVKINKPRWVIWKCIVTMLKTGLSFSWWMRKLTHSDLNLKQRLRHGSGFFLKLRLLAKKRSAHRTSKKIRQTDHKGRAKGRVSKNRVKNTWGGGGGVGGDNGHRCNTSGQDRQSQWWETHKDRMGSWNERNQTALNWKQENVTSTSHQRNWHWTVVFCRCLQDTEDKMALSHHCNVVLSAICFTIY